MKRYAAYIVILLLALTACSTKENTARSRFWHSFNAKYNTFFNGHEAYKEGMQSKEKGNADDFTERLPFFLVGNEKSAALGKGQFETAITKCEKAIQLHSIKKKPKIDPGKRRTEKGKQYLARKEYNPFLKNAWLLMGQAQFQKGDFAEAAATFSYITRLYQAEPPVAAEARAWLARCYAAQEWYYDAEDVLAKLGRDSLNTRLRNERDATMADLLLRQERLDEALPYLQRAAKKAGNKLRRARLYFLLGQVEQTLGHDRASYKALSKCLRQSPPYQLAFNARILQTEVLSEGGQSRQMLARLRRMARSDKNKNYLDQVYYAMGNIHLSAADTAAAIAAYERGRAKATRNGAEKGVLLLRLGQVYWDQQRFEKAQSCYSEALSMIDKSRKDYPEVMRRSKILDKLVPYTSAVSLQDSLQLLSVMSETDRNAAIDRVIEALKIKEKEEARARKDSLARARAEESGAMPAGNGQEAPLSRAPQKGDQTWYFYNPMLVMQGKQDFAKQWGNRKNEDNWRRANKTVVMMETAEGYDYEAEDSIRAMQDSIDAIAQEPDSALRPEDDPHRREYYLKQIPFTPEAKEASNLIIMDGLYNAGIIEKDELEDFPLAAGTLGRIVRQYPTFDKLQDTYYQLFLLYSRWGKQAEANHYRNLMAQQFPDSSTTKLILDPDYLLNARYGRAIEDSLYASAYNAYLNHDRHGVETAYRHSADKFPDGKNRPKFIFLHALSRIGTASNKEIADELRDLVQQYPQSDISELAGLIVNGLAAGRQLGDGGLAPNSLWARRAEQDSVQADGMPPALSAEREGKFVFLAAYERDSVDDNRLLYDLAHHNFTGFYVRNFDIEKIQSASGLTQFRIHGFKSYDEVHTYAQELFREKAVAEQLRHARIFLISEPNLALIGRKFSFDDYQTFFDSAFAPLPLRPDLQLDTEAEPAPQKYDEQIGEIYPREVKETPTPPTPEGKTPAPEAEAAPGTEGETPRQQEAPVVPQETEQPVPATPAPSTPAPAEEEEDDSSPMDEPEEDEDSYPMDEEEDSPTPPTRPNPLLPAPQQPQEEEEEAPATPTPSQPRPAPEEEEDDGEWFPA